MATPPQLVQMAFAAGLDESQQGEVLDPMAGFAVLQNVRQDRRGSLSKRLGYGLLDATRLDATTRTEGRRLFTNGDTVCVIDGEQVDAYSSAVDAWADHGRVPEATYRHLEAPSIGVEHPVDDVVYCNGIVVIGSTFWEGSDFYAMVSVLDATTGAVVRAPEAIDNSLSGTNLKVRLATYGSIIVAMVWKAATTAIAALYLDATSRSTVNAGWQTIATVASNAQVMPDVGSFSGRVALAYQNTVGGTSRLTVKTLNTSGVLETVNINTNSITPTGVSVSEGGSTLWVAWAEETVAGPTNTTDFRVVGLNPTDIDGTPTATTATVIQTVRTGLGGGMTWLADRGGGTGTLYAINENVFASDGLNMRSFSTSAGATTPSGTTRKLCNSTPVGRPFVRSSRVYIPVSSSILEELVVCDCTFEDDPIVLRPVVSPTQRGLPNLQLTSHPRARVAATGSNTYVFTYNVLKSGSVANGVNGIELVEFNFADTSRWLPATVGRSTYLSGGVTSVYDGRRVCEAGFLCRPPPPELDVSGGTTHTFTLGGRSYVLTYEEVDADGNWHVSGVSDPAISGNVTTQDVVVSVKPLTITARREDVLVPYGAGVRIGIWVTTDGGNAPYYRLATVQNATDQETIAYTDQAAEADFTSNALLYGTGNLPGVSGSSQDHRAPPGLTYHVAYNGMLVGVSGSTVHYGSQPIDGEGMWFSPVFSQPIDEKGTGIAVQDGTVYVFTRRGIFAGAGEPPSDNAAFGGLGAFRRLAVDVGCVNARSIVVTSRGIFFQSERGIELLNRGGSVTWVGEQVQTTLASYPIVSSAVLDARNGLVRFSLAEEEEGGVVSGEGRDIVYDLSLGAWVSVDTKFPSEGNDSQASQDAATVYVDGAWRYGWLDTNGVVYYERDTDDAEAYLDGTEESALWVTMAVETAWIKLAGIQGRQHMNKALLLARKHTRADLDTYLSYDYATASEAVTVRLADDLDALSSAMDRIQVEHQLHDESAGQAVKIKFQDATPTGGTVSTGKGATWIALTFEGVPKQGAAEVPEAGM